MAVLIELSGVFGWEIMAYLIKEQLKEANGKDVDTNISSVGGDAFEGIEVNNAYRDYKRKFPDAQLSLNFKGVVASMGANLGLESSFDLVTTEDNVAHMVHNAWTVAYGDHNELRKTADFLEGVNGPFVKAAVKRTGKTVAEITAMFDEETWSFGQGIVDAGFADMVISTDNEKIDATQARAKIKKAQTEYGRKFHRKQIDSFTDNVAASLKQTAQPAPVAEPKPEPKQELNAMEEAEIRTKAIEDEQTRTSEIMALKEGYKDHPAFAALSEIIDKAVVSKTTEKSEVLVQMQAALTSGTALAALDSPDATAQVAAVSASGEQAPSAVPAGAVVGF